MAIHRRSYRIPNRKEGIRSVKLNVSGLNAKKVANLKIVKIKRKIKNRLITHKIVFGILYRMSMKPEILILKIAKELKLYGSGNSVIGYW